MSPGIWYQMMGTWTLKHIWTTVGLEYGCSIEDQNGNL